MHNIYIMDCTKCHEKRELAKGKRWCKRCKNEYERRRRAKAGDEAKERRCRVGKEYYKKRKAQVKEIIIDNTETKKCTVCKEAKTLDHFHVAKCKGTIRAMCKKCACQKRKEYYQKNKKAVIAQTNKYKVEKMKRDPIFKLERRLRNRIYQAFKAQGERKNNRTWKYIDCSSRFFQKWIEYQLYDGMTLENYGKMWHIDHVYPCSKFDLTKEEEIAKCFSWKNLRPLRASKNIEKCAKIQNIELVLQELKVKTFLRENKSNGQKSILPTTKGSVVG